MRKNAKRWWIQKYVFNCCAYIRTRTTNERSKREVSFFFVEREINPWGLKSAVIDASRKGEQMFTYTAPRAYFCLQFMGGFLAGTCAGSNVKKNTYKKKHPCKKRTLNLFEMIRRKCSISALRFR